MDVQLLLCDGVMFVVPASFPKPVPEPHESCNMGSANQKAHSMVNAMHSVLAHSRVYPLLKDSSASLTNISPDKTKVASESSPADAHLEQSAIASNLGSVGHPHFCRRPCLYHRKGTCQRGTQCGFCHCSHDDSQPMHLDKLKKDLLRAMSLPDREAFLAHVLHQGLDKLRDGLGTARLVQDWRIATREVARREAFELPKLPGVKPSNVTKLLGRLSRMTLTVVLGIARSICGDSKLVQATDHLLEALRLQQSQESAS